VDFFAQILSAQFALTQTAQLALYIRHSKSGQNTQQAS